MADINPILNVNTANMTNLAQGATRPAESQQTAREQVREIDVPEKRMPERIPPEAPERQGRVEVALDNVLSVSKDGDTVQATDEALRELKEDENIGRVIGSPDNSGVRQTQNGSDSRIELMELELERSAEIRRAQLEAAQAEADERREAAIETAREETDDRRVNVQGTPNAVLADENETIAEQGQINSFIGYTDAELERLYLKGDISRFDYDQEMESREETREASRTGLDDFALETAAEAGEARQTRQAGQEIERAFSENANERLDAAQRAQVLQAMQRTQNAGQETANDPNQVAALTNFSLG